MDKAEYEALCQRLIKDFKQNPKNYINWDDVCKHLCPGVDEFEDLNRNVAVEAAAHLKLKMPGFLPAMKRKLRQMDQEIARQERMARSNATFGGTPKDAREAVAMYVNTNGVHIRYDGSCYQDGKLVLPGSIEAAILLTAESNGYTIGDGKIMTNKGIQLAWAEWLEMARAERLSAVWEQIEKTDKATATKALAQFRDLCNHLFTEPEFAFWAIVKFIWQTKRRLQGLYIKDHHLLVFQGPQGSGKTELAREIIRPVKEIAVESTLEQMLDARNFQLRSMFVGFTDELARAERQDLNQIKSLVTGETTTARVLYSHVAQKNPVNLNLIGTADRPLTEIISDQAGMRRLVVCVMKPRHARTLDWEQDVVAMPWAEIWRAVDHTTSDPLMTRFEDLLKEKQELLRGKSNVECWLNDFEFTPGVTKAHAHEPGRFAEFTAKHLYSSSFRMYEERFHPGSKETSLTMWGLKFKALIEDGKAPRWSVRKASNNTLYRFELTAEDARPRLPGNGVTVADDVAQRAKLRQIILEND